jgi:hypothetical protein
MAYYPYRPPHAHLIMVIPSTEEINLSTKLIFCIIKDEQRLVAYILFIKPLQDGTELHRRTAMDGRKDQIEDVEMRNLRPDTPWFDAVERQDIRRLSFLSLAGFSCSSTASNQGVSGSKFLISKSLFWSSLSPFRVGRYRSVSFFFILRMSGATLTLQCVEPRRFQTKFLS